MRRPPATRYCAVCTRPVNIYTRDREVFCQELCRSQWRGIRSDRDAVIFALYYGRRMTPQGIGELYSITRQTVDTALRRQ